MKTLSATHRPYDHWKAESLSFLHVLLVLGVALTSLLIKTRQSLGCDLIVLILTLSPYRGKLMDPYGSTNARHQLFLFVLGPISYVGVDSVSTYVHCTRRLISKKIFFCSRRRLQYRKTCSISNQNVPPFLL